MSSMCAVQDMVLGAVAFEGECSLFKGCTVRGSGWTIQRYWSFDHQYVVRP